jgi:hypothetical protein
MFVADPVPQSFDGRARPGIDMSFSWRLSPSYYLGVSGEIFTAVTEKSPISVWNNLLMFETLKGRLRVSSFALQSTLEIPSERRLKLSIRNRLGIRSCAYEIQYDGQFLVIFTSKDIYEKKSTGLVFDLGAGLYLPFGDKDRSVCGLAFYSGIHTGSKISYVNPASVVLNEDSSFSPGPEVNADATFWMNSLSFVLKVGSRD